MFDCKLNVINAILTIDNIVNSELGRICASKSKENMDKPVIGIAIIPGSVNQAKRLHTVFTDFGFEFIDTHGGDCHWDSGECFYINKTSLTEEKIKNTFWTNNSLDYNKNKTAVNFDKLTFSDFRIILDYFNSIPAYNCDYQINVGKEIVIDSRSKYSDQLFEALFGNINGKEIDDVKIKFNSYKEEKMPAKKKIGTITLINKYLESQNDESDNLNSMMINFDDKKYTLYLDGREDSGFNEFVKNETGIDISESDWLEINGDSIELVDYSDEEVFAGEYFLKHDCREGKIYTGLGNKKPLTLQKFKELYYTEEEDNEIDVYEVDTVIKDFFDTENKIISANDKMSFVITADEHYLFFCTEKEYENLSKLIVEKFGKKLEELNSEDFDCHLESKRVDPCSIKEFFESRYSDFEDYFKSKNVHYGEDDFDIFENPRIDNVRDMRVEYEDSLSNQEFSQYVINNIKKSEKIDYVVFDNAGNIKVHLKGNFNFDDYSLDDLFNIETDNYNCKHNSDGETTSFTFTNKLKITKTNLSFERFCEKRKTDPKNQKYTNYILGSNPNHTELLEPLNMAIEESIPALSKPRELTIPTFTDILKNDAIDASYKVAANKFTDIFKALIINMVAKKSDSDKVREVCKFFDTEYGAGLLQYGIGQFIMHSGLFDELDQKYRLSNEFRTGGIARFEESMIDSIMPGLNNIMDKFSKEPKKSIRVSIPELESKTNDDLESFEEEALLKSKC